MTSRDFCYWLQGFFEIEHAGPATVAGGGRIDRGLTHDRVEVVKKHLALVFKHEIDPSMGPPAHQQALDAIHHGGKISDKVLRC